MASHLGIEIQVQCGSVGGALWVVTMRAVDVEVSPGALVRAAIVCIQPTNAGRGVIGNAAQESKI